MKTSATYTHILHPSIFFVLLLGLFTGCGKKSRQLADPSGSSSFSGLPSLEGVTDSGATAILLSAKGELLDFVQVAPDAGIERIEFMAPANGEEIQSMVVGPSLDASVLAGLVVTAKDNPNSPFKDDPFFKAKITIHVENGFIMSHSGKGFSTKNPLTLNHLEQVRDAVASGTWTHPKTTLIVKQNRYLADLVKDDAGNDVPSNMTPEEKAFIASAVPALKNKDMEVLSTLLHSEPGVPVRPKSHFMGLFSQGVEGVLFRRFDPDHPDDQIHLRGFEGKPIRLSLKPEWILEPRYKQEGMGAALLVGSDQSDKGKLKFLTKYAR